MLKWIEQLFDGIKYYDFPSFEVALFSLMLAFLLSGLIAMVYRWTFNGLNFPNDFFQGMVLSSTVSAMIMMAVGSNLAVGFGIIGAVAIIRFRTNIQNPRNIIFIFASLSVGIATGVYGYAIAVAGTISFCLISVVLFFSPYGKKHPHYELVLISAEEDRDATEVLVRFCANWVLEQKRVTSEGVFRSDYTLLLKSEDSYQAFFQELHKTGHWQEIRLELRSQLNQL